MKKLFAIIAVAGLLTACNNEEAAKKEAADKATADSVRAEFVADSIKAATTSPIIDSMKAKMEGAVDKIKAEDVELRESSDEEIYFQKAAVDKMKEALKKN